MTRVSMPRSPDQSARTPEKTTKNVYVAHKDTLEFHLRPFRVPMDVIREKHSAALGLLARLLGTTPHAPQYLELWPDGLETFNVILPNMFDIPCCDFRLGSVPPDTRGITAYVASRTYGCSYCSAHTAVMGNLWDGSRQTLDKCVRALEPEPSRNVFSSQQIAAINIAKKVAAVPATVTRDEIRQLANEFSAKEQEAVVNVIANMGFLNRFMDTSGMTLEMDLMEVSLTKLGPTGWSPGHAFDADADADLVEQDKLESRKDEERAKNAGFFSMVKMIVGAKWADHKAMSKIPSSDKGIYERCKRETGFLPFYIRQMQDSAAKRSFTYGYLLRLNQGSREVPAALKQVMCFLCAKNAGNHVLKAHFAFLAHRNGVSIERLAEVADDDSAGGGDSPAEDAAMALAQAASWTPSHVESSLSDLLVRLFSPSAVIELLISLSIYSAIYRWTSVYIPTEYESEISSFVQQHGEALNIPASPCTREQSEWAEMASRIRKGVNHE